MNNLMEISDKNLMEIEGGSIVLTVGAAVAIGGVVAWIYNMKKK